jgi:hypothetical protein
MSPGLVRKGVLSHGVVKRGCCVTWGYQEQFLCHLGLSVEVILSHSVVRSGWSVTLALSGEGCYVTWACQWREALIRTLRWLSTCSQISPLCLILDRW